jgi:hypothetical protein
VTDNGSIGARRPRECAFVTSLGLDIANSCSFGDLANGQDVANRDGGLLAAEDVLAGVGTFSRQEVFVFISIFVGVAELNLSEGCASSGIVNNALDDTSDVTVPLRIVKSSVIRRGNSSRLVRLEDTLGLTLSLA